MDSIPDRFIFALNMNKQKLIDYLIANDGKPENETWYDLGLRFGIGDGLSQGKRAKKTQDMWRSYKRSESYAKDNESTLPIKKLKTWETYAGVKRTSVEYNVPVENSIKALEEAKRQFIEDAKRYAPKYDTVSYKHHLLYSGERLLEISIPDLHAGKMSWIPETDEDYNIRLAVNRFKEAIEYFLEIGKAMQVTRFLLPIGNDLLNSEGLSQATTGGTPQQDDCRYQKSFTMVRKMLVESIDKLRKVAPVDIVVVSGNHDRERCYYIGETLECWYHNCDEVKIDNSPKLRKYYRYGKSLIGYTHGSDEKHDHLPIIMATETPKDFADTKFRFWHLGHLHKYQVQEQFGITVRILPSLCSTDAWHKQHGFVGNLKAAQAYLYSKTEGYLAHFQYTI